MIADVRCSIVRMRRVTRGKVCFECAMPLIEDGAEVTTTPKMVADAKNYWRKKMQ